MLPFLWYNSDMNQTPGVDGYLMQDLADLEKRGEISEWGVENGSLRITLIGGSVLVISASTDEVGSPNIDVEVEFGP